MFVTRMLVLFGLVVLLAKETSCQLSAPVSTDEHISVDNNKFLQRSADLDKDPETGAAEEEIPSFMECPQNIELRWQSEVSSSVYATPLITDLFSDGRKDIIVPSFVHYLEVLEGPSGGAAPGWPAFHKSTVHASPLLYDINFDGTRDVLIATYDGEVRFFNEKGEALSEMLRVDRLRVRKHWFATASGSGNQTIPGGTQDAGKSQAAPVAAATVNVTNGIHATAAVNATNGSHATATTNATNGSHATATANGTAPVRTATHVTNGSHAAATTNGTAPVGAATHVTNGSHATATANGTAPVDAATHVLPPSPPLVRAALTLPERVNALIAQLKLTREASGEAAATKLLQEVRTTSSELFMATQQALLAEKKLAATALRRKAGSPKAMTSTTTAQRRRSLLSMDSDSSSVEDNDASGSGSMLEAGDTRGSAGSGRRRRSLLAAAGGGGGGDAEIKVAVGVESGPLHRLSAEAEESFEVFKGEDDVGGGLRDVEDGDLLAAEAGYADDEESQQQLDDSHLVGDENGDVAYDEFGEKFRDGHETYTGAAEDGAEESGELGVAGGGSLMGDAAMTDPRINRQAYLDDYEERIHARLGRHKGLPADNNWEDESFQQPLHAQDPDFVSVDAHILATPAIGDLDGDGHDELVIAVSYFFDREYYDDPARVAELAGVDLGKYIASGIVVFNLHSRTVKWSQHLDLSTDTTSAKAYAYSSPTLVDLDGDGTLEIVVGTSLGYLYVLSADGTPREGWPIQMGEIQGQPLVGDLNNDGKLEICVGDTRGNVAMFNTDGEELWERHMHSLISQAAVAADINGDGAIEVVFGTSSGHVHAVSGATGLDVPNFPFRTHGRIHSPVLVTRLTDGPAQQLVVSSFDGFMYIIDGGSGCADSVDIGETSYSMILADDLDMNGRLDLLLTTMNGNVYMFETPAEYHPLKAWTSQSQGPNGLTARHDYLGIYATADSRRLRDMAGYKLHVRLNVIDKRMVFADNGTLVPIKGGPYNISAVLKGVGVTDMQAGHSPVIGVADTVSVPGSYLLDLPCPRSRATAVVRLEMTDRFGLQLSDEFAMSFHLHFHKLLKWLVALPLAGMVVILLALGTTSVHTGYDSGVNGGTSLGLPVYVDNTRTD